MSVRKTIRDVGVDVGHASRACVPAGAKLKVLNAEPVGGKWHITVTVDQTGTGGL